MVQREAPSAANTTRTRHSERSEESHPVRHFAGHYVERVFVVMVWALQHG
jgi:hypothetical protein